jgi:hypothetical protein
MSGSKYSYAVTQLESQGVLNPDVHMFVQEDFYQADPNAVTSIMTQLSHKTGLKEWGDKAFMAAQSEMKQLHFRNTFKPKHWRELSQVQRQTLLESHMFIKQKQDENIKGRTVAGGNRQLDCISKEDASSQCWESIPGPREGGTRACEKDCRSCYLQPVIREESFHILTWISWARKNTKDNIVKQQVLQNCRNLNHPRD